MPMHGCSMEEKKAKYLTHYISELVSGDSLQNSPCSPSLDVILFRVSSVSSHRSQRSERSRQSVLSHRSIAGYIERSSFSVREWLILCVEMLISFAWYVIRNRRRVNSDLLRRGLTERMEVMDIYLKRGQSAPFAIIAGYLADTYWGIYPFALINVTLHFVISALILMETLINHTSNGTLYAEIVSETVGFSFIPLKATDFARLVFGLEQIGRKNIKVVLLFLFLSLWLNERSCGGVLILLYGVLEASKLRAAEAAFICCAISSFLYWHVFYPNPDQTFVLHGVGNKIIGCIISAVRTKRRVDNKIKRKSWIDYAEISYERIYVTKTKQLLRLYLMLLPTIGLLIFVTSRSDFYVSIWARMKPQGLFVYTEVGMGTRVVAITAMGIIAFVVQPILNKLGFQRKFLRRFIVGYLCALLCYFWASWQLRAVEGIDPSTHVGLVRIFNSRDRPIQIISENDREFKFNTTVGSSKATMMALERSEVALIKMTIIFDSLYNFTTYLAVTPNEVTGYIVVFPANILRVKGFLPVMESPPGFNVNNWPRLLISNFIRRERLALALRDVKHGREYTIIVLSGKSAPLQVLPGRYQLSDEEKDLAGNKTIDVGPGGVYSIMVYSTLTEHLIVFDKLVEENSRSSFYSLGISISYALCLVFGYVTLRAFLFANTPEGLEGLSFGFLEMMENSTSWIIWIGFQTWHPFITSLSITVYLVIITLLFFICLFILVKNEELYRW